MRGLIETQLKPEKVFLFAVDSNKDNPWPITESLNELAQLARTAGLTIVGRDYQKLVKINPATYFGKGKLLDVIREMAELDAGVLITDEELSPGQQKNLEKVEEV